MITFYGDRVRVIRQFLGLSLAEVSEKIGVSRQYVHQIETGATTPSDLILQTLADALSVERGFFHAPLANPVRVDHAHFRRLRSTPVSLTQEMLSYATLFESLLGVIERTVKFPALNFPSIGIASVNEIEQAAERCRMEWGLTPTAPIANMTRVVERAGAVVAEFDDLSSKIDALSFARGRPVIVRNTNKESLFRQRFDLAHECGHLVLHQGLITGDSITEGQANRFASAFLLPAESFAREFRKTQRFSWDLVFDLKVRWRVSAAAIVYRAFELALIDKSEFQKAFVYLSNSGQRKRERLDDDFALESPESLKKSLLALSSAGRESIKSLARKMQVSELVIKRLIGFTGILKEMAGETEGKILNFDRKLSVVK